MRTLVLSPILFQKAPVLHLPASSADTPVADENAPSSAKPKKSSKTGFGEPGTPEYRLAEATGLAEAIQLDIEDAQTVFVPNPKPGLLFGSGKVDEIRDWINLHEIDLVVVNHVLTPVQQRNLEKAWDVKILDRTGLILEIFGERARTREGRMQVELAHLDYQKSRLVRSWTHLERQRGGSGFLGGPGETQIEADRRQIRERMAAIRRDLDKVRQTRELHRMGRRKVPYPVVSLVGYTNAGKSTLFNRLTGASVMVKDMLFATLDPTMRELSLPSGQKIILSDTVGFISDLPTLLVEAFRATLEEVLEADLILHVRDISSRATEAQKEDVEKVLDELKVFEADPPPHLIEVWNKTDLLEEEKSIAVHRKAVAATPEAACISAATGAGVPELLEMIDRKLAVSFVCARIHLAPADGTLVGWLHDNARILDKAYEEDGFLTLTTRLTRPAFARLQSRLEQLESTLEKLEG